MSRALRAPALSLIAALSLCSALAASGCTTTRTVSDRDTYRAPPPAYDNPPPVDAGIRDVSQFYEPLSPYGSWQPHPAYGLVFVPARSVVGPGFHPYTRGNWTYTEWGWTWASHLPFGWATDHYGRWFDDRRSGWVWVPDTAWAPAWVAWRTGGAYIGWAPLPPGATYGGRYTVHEASWVFVSAGDFGAPAVSSVIITGPGYDRCYRSTRPHRQTAVVYGRTYYRGPDPDDVHRRGGRVSHRPIADVDRDRPTTRPPRGTAIARPGSDRGHGGHEGSVGGRTGDRPSSTPRTRDDDDRGSSRGRDDDDRGGSRGRGHDDDDDDDRAGSRGRGDDDRAGSRGRGDDDDDDRKSRAPRSRKGGDKDRGHGNDADRDDEDNPGRGRSKGDKPDRGRSSSGRGR